jgi:hypothetical protein
MSNEDSERRTHKAKGIKAVSWYKVFKDYQLRIKKVTKEPTTKRVVTATKKI